MTAKIIERSEQSVTIQVEIPLNRSMQDSEVTIQRSLNSVGLLATQEALKQFDTDGSPIEIGSIRLTSKSCEPKAYQTPFGEIVVHRHVYQSSAGGATFCPLERDARIVGTATPRFAMLISSKYADMPAGRVVDDLEQTMCRSIARSFVQDIAQTVASIAQIKEEQWQYSVPKLESPIKTVSIGVDGTCTMMVVGGNRQVMLGTISLYDEQGERQHTIYVAAAPEYGKGTFLERMTREIQQVKKVYPAAHTTGIADGSADNWAFLRQHCQSECIDYYHMCQYLNDAAEAKYPKKREGKEEWVEEAKKKLLEEVGYAEKLTEEIEKIKGTWLSKAAGEKLKAAQTYFRNHHHQMKYAERRKANQPIGSGVTEAACKMFVKLRMCRNGARWKDEGAKVVLSLQSLCYTEGRWEQFWQKIDRFGVPMDLAL